MSPDPAALLDELRTRLLQYPAERYPVQHATLQSQLGSMLLAAGDPGGAIQALRMAIATYDAAMLVERARAANLLGAAYRDASHPAEAADAFTAAAAAFAESERPLEQAAALHNLGLTLRDRGDSAEAVEHFTTALEAFEAGQTWPQAAAAARELAAVLLETGDAEQAARTAGRAVEHADRAADMPALGSAENIRGLAELAAGRWQQAVTAFSRSAGAHPRNVRPEGYAMAKANLALAYERAGDHPRARLAARQALAAPAVPSPVETQAHAVLERLGDDRADLHNVLDDEPLQRWPPVLREELTWWPEAGRAQLTTRTTAFVDGLVDHPQALDRVHAMFDVLLELPPHKMEAIVDAVMEALADRPPDLRQRIHGLVDRTLPRFPIPQWQRLAACFNAAAAQRLGEDVRWL